MKFQVKYREEVSDGVKISVPFVVMTAEVISDGYEDIKEVCASLASLISLESRPVLANQQGDMGVKSANGKQAPKGAAAEN